MYVAQPNFSCKKAVFPLEKNVKMSYNIICMYIFRKDSTAYEKNS